MENSYSEKLWDTISPILQDYKQMHDAYDECFNTEAQDYRELEGLDDINDFFHLLGAQAEMFDDERTQKISETYKEELENPSLAWVFRNQMVEEDYEAAAILTDQDPEDLEDMYSEEIDMMREVRDDFNYPKPNGSANTDKNEKDFLTLLTNFDRFKRGDLDDIEVKETIEAATDFYEYWSGRISNLKE